MLTAKEQYIIDRVEAEYLKYCHLEAYPPYEQDNIPNPFRVLSREESLYVQEHPYMLDVLNDCFKKSRLKRGIVL